MPALTKRICDAAKPGERQYILWCSDLPRFGLRVRENGSRVFIAQFRAGGRTRIMTLGSFGVLTVDQARREARKILGDVERGTDPAAKRDQRREVLSVRDLGARWLAQHVAIKRKASTAKEDARLLAKIVYPALGRRSAADVSPHDVARLHASLAKTPVTANRVLSLLHALFAFGESIGARATGPNPARAKRPGSPGQGVQKFKETGRARYLSEVELSRLGMALAEAERTGAEEPETVAAIRLLLLTGCRKSEILGTRWHDVDFERGMLRLEDAKAGPRDVLLSAPALAVLGALPRRNEWIIPGREHGCALVNISKPWRRIRGAAGLEGVRLHDLRHSHASVGVAANVSLHLLGGLLGHRQPRTTGRYAHLSDDPLRKASDAIGARLSAALEGRPDADVIPLRDSK